MNQPPGQPPPPMPDGFPPEGDPNHFFVSVSGRDGPKPGFAEFDANHIQGLRSLAGVYLKSAIQQNNIEQMRASIALLDAAGVLEVLGNIANAGGN